MHGEGGPRRYWPILAPDSLEREKVPRTIKRLREKGGFSGDRKEAGLFSSGKGKKAAGLFSSGKGSLGQGWVVLGF